MSRKSKVEITAESVRKAITEGKFSSLTGLAHSLGYKGSVSSSLTKMLRAILPDIDALLAANKPNAPAKGDKTETVAGKVVKAVKAKAAKLPAKPVATPKDGKWPVHPQNPFGRPSSAYHVCFNILASHAEGLPREKLIDLLAEATGKPPKLAAFDAQVVLSARGNEPGLNPHEGPRNRSCRFGFWVKRENSHVKLVLPAASAASSPAKESP